MADKQTKQPKAAPEGKRPKVEVEKIELGNDYVPRMAEMYQKQIKPQLIKEQGYTNPFQTPRLTKIVLNMGVGKAAQDKKLLEAAMNDMRLIAGQQPVPTYARKGVANFGVRQGMAIGCKVTLRGRRMYEFLDRLITVALPRVRDFEGVSHRSFDGKGNYAMGVKEQIVFQEIEFDKTDRVRGMDIIICTTATTDEDARALLAGFGMPFRRSRQQQQQEA